VRRKTVSGIMLMLLLIGMVSVAFQVFPITAEEPPIKIGVMRNLFMQGQGMEEGATLAAEEINDAGGILGREVVLAFGDEGTEAITGLAEIVRLITVEDVDFITGGFRTEIVIPMKEVAMDYKKIFIITGTSFDELINCEGSLDLPNCCHCVRCDYARYKYLFRVIPNSTVSFWGTLIPYLQNHLVPMLGGSEESPVKVVAVLENLAWTDEIATIYENLFTLYFGTTMEKVRDKPWRPGHLDTDFSSVLTAIKDSGAQLIIHMFSGEAGLAYVKQWREMEIPAVTIGINALSQNSEMWTDTEGKCEYEAFISTPPRVPITEKTIPYWDSYVARWGHDPIYTSFGAYDAIYVLKDAIERAGTLDSDTVVTALEETDLTITTGRLKFTQYHDAMCGSYIEPLIVQWQNGVREVVYPLGKPYTKDFQIPPWIGPPPPSHTLMVDSSPSGVSFTVDGVSRTTPWSGTYSEGASVSLVMPGFHDGYIWYHWWWIEDGDLITDRNRTKSVIMDTDITLTGYYIQSSFRPGTGEATKIWLMDASDPTAVPATYPDGQQYIELNDTYGVGDTFTVWANVTNVTELWMYQVGVTYDPAILECTGYGEGELFYRAPQEYRTDPPNQPILFDDTGYLGYWNHVAWVLKKPGNVSGTGTLAWFSFRVVGDGVTLIDIILTGPPLAILKDAHDNYIDFNTIDIVFDNRGYVPPGPVGGKATPINIPINKLETPPLWIWLTTIILSLAVTVVYVKKRKRKILS